MKCTLPKKTVTSINNVFSEKKKGKSLFSHQPVFILQNIQSDHFRTIKKHNFNVFPNLNLT